ncbi:MAG: hypothetical protein MUF00_17815, partial [Gemmatimonadaceae bacterium]|nr:hypothetical protein [Gemmatimonadaceae bacterium]
AGFVGQLTLTEFRSLREAVRSFDLRGVPAGFGDEEFAMIGFPHRGVALAIGRDQVDAFAGLLDGALLLLHCDGLLTAHSPPFEPTRDDPACDEPHD